MSARCWYRRKSKPPVYLVEFDWWSDDILLHGPPRPATRLEIARHRRLRRIQRRRPRPFPEAWIQMGATEQPWAFPDADVMGDLRRASAGRWPLS